MLKKSFKNFLPSIYNSHLLYNTSIYYNQDTINPNLFRSIKNNNSLIKMEFTKRSNDVNHFHSKRPHLSNPIPP